MDLQSWGVVAGVVVAVLAARRLLGGPRAAADVVAQRINGGGATIVDVRSPGEFGAGAYPGAVNIPLGSLGSRLDEIPKDRPVILYCASGLRSASAVRLLKRAGYVDVLNAGGVRHMPW